MKFDPAGVPRVYRRTPDKKTELIEPDVSKPPVHAGRFLLAGSSDRRSTAAIVIARESDVASGTVKFFNTTKGYGFIAPDTGGKDVFVHISAVERAGLSTLAEGAKVTFDVVENRGKESAENLRVK